MIHHISIQDRIPFFIKFQKNFTEYAVFRGLFSPLPAKIGLRPEWNTDRYSIQTVRAQCTADALFTLGVLRVYVLMFVCL